MTPTRNLEDELFEGNKNSPYASFPQVTQDILEFVPKQHRHSQTFDIKDNYLIESKGNIGIYKEDGELKININTAQHNQTLDHIISRIRSKNKPYVKSAQKYYLGANTNAIFLVKKQESESNMKKANYPSIKHPEVKLELNCEDYVSIWIKQDDNYVFDKIVAEVFENLKPLHLVHTFTYRALKLEFHLIGYQENT